MIQLVSVLFILVMVAAVGGIFVGRWSARSSAKKLPQPTRERVMVVNPNSVTITAPAMELEEISTTILLNEIVYRIHKVHRDRGWWSDLQTGASLCCSYPDVPEGSKSVGNVVSLIHSEVSEAYEAHRKTLKDDKVPEYWGFEVELADALIRICDAAGGYSLALSESVEAKLRYNSVRNDHSTEDRKTSNGKKT